MDKRGVNYQIGPSVNFCSVLIRGVHGLGWVGFRAGWFGLKFFKGGLVWVGFWKKNILAQTKPNQTMAGWVGRVGGLAHSNLQTFFFKKKILDSIIFLIFQFFCIEF